MGGLAAGAVDRNIHHAALWEMRVDALMVLCTAKGLFSVDRLRRAIEDLGPDAYEAMSYYERWIASINQNLVEFGIYTLAELGERMAEIEARGDTYGDAAETK